MPPGKRWFQILPLDTPENSALQYLKACNNVQQQCQELAGARVVVETYRCNFMEGPKRHCVPTNIVAGSCIPNLVNLRGRTTWNSGR